MDTVAVSARRKMILISLIIITIIFYQSKARNDYQIYLPYPSPNSSKNNPNHPPDRLKPIPIFIGFHHSPKIGALLSIIIIKMKGINIRNLVFKQLLFELNEQYENNTFEINTCVRHATETILDRRQKFNIQVDEKQANNIRMEINLFVFALIKAPSIWVDMLRNDKISSTTSIITINTTETLTEVYKEIIMQANQLITQAYSKGSTIQPGNEFNFEKEYISEPTKSMIAYLLNSLAQQICKFYHEGKNILLKEQKSIQEELKKSEIMNAYFLFGILKQMSSRTYQQIEEEMSLYFKNLPAETITKFCRYVQKNYQFVDLVCSDSVVKLYTDQQMRQSIDLQNEYWLNFLSSFGDNQLTLKKVQSDKGDTAVMIIKNKKKDDQNEESFNDAEKLIMKIGENNQIYVTNLQASQKRWEIFNMKDSVSGFYKLLKNGLTSQTAEHIEKDIVAYGVPLGQYSNLGGNLGKCIANINKYKSANHFFKDLSKNTVIGGSMTFIFREIPILTYFAIAGGLTYTFYHTFNNKATSHLKKAKQVGKVTVTAMGSVGSAVAGMMLGQTLIPVPFLGAFVGGLIGGFLGQTGTNLMTTLMNKQSYQNLINYLKDEIVHQKYWKYSKQLLEKLGIREKYFNTEVCQEADKKDAYITAICFCVASSYEAKRYIARNQQKMKELQQNKQKKNEAELLAEEETFDNDFDIVGIVDYLTAQKLILLDELEKLEKCIRHLSI